MSLLLAGTAMAGVDPVVRGPEPRSSITVSVGDFLHDASGAAVSPFRAFEAAIAKARDVKAARLVIPPGRYVFDDPAIRSAHGHIGLYELSDLEIDGQGAELVFTDTRIGGITLALDQRLVLKNFSIEWDAPLASPAVAMRQPDGRIALRILDGYPATPQTSFEAVSEFDIARRRWKASRIETYDARDVEMIAPQTFTSPDFARFADGAEVLVRHRVYGANAIGAFTPSLHDVAFENITVYSAPGMAFFFGAVGQGIRISHCVVKPREGMLISTTADAAHFATTGGHIIVEDCDFSGQGDDALNISAHWLEIVEQPSPERLRLVVAHESAYYSDWIVPGVMLAFHSRETLEEVAVRTVVAVEQDSVRREYRVVLDEPVNIAAGRAPLVNTKMMDSSTYVVRNNYFHDNRARGMLIQTPHGRIEGNVVRNPTMSCLNVTTDASTFFEGYGATDLLVTRNRFEGCNYAGERVANHRLGAVNVVAEVERGFATSVVHSDVVFEGNEIADTPGLAMLLASGRRISVRNNAIVDSNLAPLEGETAPAPMGSVMITHASDVVVSRLYQSSTRPTFAKGVYVDALTTSGVVVIPSPERRRAAGR